MPPAPPSLPARAASALGSVLIVAFLVLLFGTACAGVLLPADEVDKSINHFLGRLP